MMYRLLAIVVFVHVTQQAYASEVVLTINDAVNKAMQNSAQIQAAEARRESARSQVKSANAGFLPSLSLEAQAGTLRDRSTVPGEAEAPLVPRDRNEYRANLLLKQNLFAGFRDIETLHKRKMAEQLRDLELEQMRSQIMVDVVRLYFAIQLAKIRLAATLETQQLREKQLKQVRDRARVGRATDLEVTEAQYAFEAEKPEIHLLKAEIETKTFQLIRLMGLKLDASLTLKDSLDTIQGFLGDKNVSLPELYKQALTNNPDLKIKATAQEELTAEYRIQKARHLPELNIELRAGTSAFRQNEFGEPSSETYSGMLVLSVPLFSGFSSFSDRHSYEKSLMALKADESHKREDLFVALNQAFRQWHTAKSRIMAEQTNNKLADKTVSQAESLYRAGRATLQQVLDAYSKRLQAKRALAEAKYEQIVAHTDLLVLTGGTRFKKETG